MIDLKTTGKTMEREFLKTFEFNESVILKELFPNHRSPPCKSQLLELFKGEIKDKLRLDFPSLETTVQVLKNHPRLLARSPRLTPASLLAKLENDKLPRLNNAFDSQATGIDKKLFVRIVKNEIQDPNYNSVDLVNGLMQLFDDIDINGDGNMEWSEFSQFVLDRVADEEIDLTLTNVPISELKLLSQAFSKKPTKYVPGLYKSLVNHPSFVSKIVPTRKSTQFFILENGASEVQHYDQSFHIIGKYGIKKESIYDEKSMVLSCSYDTHEQILCFVSSERKMFFFDGGSRKSLLWIHKCYRHDAYLVFYFGSKKQWITASTGHFLTLWSFNKDEIINQGPITVSMN